MTLGAPYLFGRRFSGCLPLVSGFVAKSCEESRRASRSSLQTSSKQSSLRPLSLSRVHPPPSPATSWYERVLSCVLLCCVLVWVWCLCVFVCVLCVSFCGPGRDVTPQATVGLSGHGDRAGVGPGSHSNNPYLQQTLAGLRNSAKG